MRALVWVCVKLSRLFLLIGGLCLLGLAASLLLALFGEDSYPTPFSGPDGSLGTYVWQVAAMTIASYVLWRITSSMVWLLGNERAIFATMGREDEYDGAVASLLAREQRAGLPVLAWCLACRDEFVTWDEALDHADKVHGHDRLPEEARALLVRCDSSTS